MLTLRYNEPVFILMLRGRVGCLRQPTLLLSIRTKRKENFVYHCNVKCFVRAAFHATKLNSGTSVDLLLLIFT